MSLEPANNKITVSVEYDQKESASIGGSKIVLAKEFNHNRRESMPVCCKVINGNGHVANGAYLLVHHNRFAEGSPHHLEDNIYSLPYNSSIFAKLDKEGNATGLCDNILVTQIYENPSFFIPDQLKKPHPFKYKVINSGFGFKKNQVIYALDFSNYEIVYNWENIEKRVIKIVKSDIVGKISEK